MHDLEFVPSESVWAGIQQGIAPRERRRAVAILWWLFPGMMLIGGGVMMYRHAASTSGIASVAPGRGAPVRGGHGSAGNGGAASGGTGRVDGVAGKISTDATSEAKADGDASARTTTDGGASTLTTEDGGVSKQSMTKKSGAEQRGTEQDLAEKAENRDNMAEASGSAASRRVRGSWFHPGLIGVFAARREIYGPLLNVPVNTAVDGIRRPKHPWMVGFVAGGGGSTVYSRGGNALVTGSPTNAGVFNYNYAGNNAGGSPLFPQARPTFSNGGAARPEQTGTNVGINYSYWAGIYGERQLSERWAVDIGLNLHYYSVRFETETLGYSYAPTSASLIAASSLTYAINTAGAYAGTTQQMYINSYYFLEVPVTAQLRLNRSRVTPLFWRGGVVGSYLVSSNGLYYDNSSGTYKSDNGVIRRAQASVSTGLAVGLPLRGVQIQAGPEIQYALTSMLKPSPGGGNMLYGGLRVALMR